MASNRKQTSRIRKNKHVAGGKARKKQIRKVGTTPVFPIHVEESK